MGNTIWEERKEGRHRWRNTGWEDSKEESRRSGIAGAIPVGRIAKGDVGKAARKGVVAGATPVGRRTARRDVGSARGRSVVAAAIPARRTSRRSVIAGAIPVGRTAGRSVAGGATPAGGTATGCVGRAAGRDGVVAGAISAERTAGKNVVTGAMPAGGTAKTAVEEKASEVRRRHPYMHVVNALLFLIVLALLGGTILAGAVGTWNCSGCCREEGLVTGVPQIERDGGRFPLGVPGGSIDQQCRTDFCALKYARSSFNLTTSVESGLVFETLSGVPRGEGLALAVAGDKEVGPGCCSGGWGIGHGLERGVPQTEDQFCRVWFSADGVEALSEESRVR